MSPVSLPLLQPNPNDRSKCIRFPGERCCWRLSISSTSFSCFGFELFHVLDPSFLPHLLWALFWAHPAVVVADESFTEDLPTNTSSFLMDIQELMLLHQPKNSSSGSQHSPSTAHLMEYTEFSPLFSQCSFCCSSDKGS